MAGLKEIRSRITTVKTTKQVTSAMKMVSAAKLKRAQDNIINARPFASRLQRIVGHLLTDPEQAIKESPFLHPKKSAEKVLIVAFASNKGLCGAFNSSIAKSTIALYDDLKRQEGEDNVDIYILGKQLEKQLKSKNCIAQKTFHEVWDDMAYDKVEYVASILMNSFVRGEYKQIIFVYNRFRNAATQLVQNDQFLPIKRSQPSKDDSQEYFDYIFEPDAETVLFELIPHALKTQYYATILDSFASEQGARMTAMHKATDNASDLLRQLTLKYNKVRQTAITNEILEITGGAEALK